MNICKNCNREFSINLDWQIKCKAPGYGESNVVVQTVSSPADGVLFCPFCGVKLNKETGPFSVEEHEAKTYDCWFVAFKDRPSPSLFCMKKTAQRWRDWLNDLWAQRDEASDARNCVSCGAGGNCLRIRVAPRYDSCSDWRPKSVRLRYSRVGGFVAVPNQHCGTHALCAKVCCPCDDWSPE